MENIAEECIKKFKRKSFIKDCMIDNNLKEISFFKNNDNYMFRMTSINNESICKDFTYRKKTQKKTIKKDYTKRRDSGYESDYIDNLEETIKNITDCIYINNKYIKKREIDTYEEENKCTIYNNIEEDDIIRESKKIIKDVDNYFNNRINFEI